MLRMASSTDHDTTTKPVITAPTRQSWLKITAITPMITSALPTICTTNSAK